MKSVKVLLLILTSGIIAASCKKEEKQRKAFYVSQDRNPDVVGIYHYYDNQSDTLNYQIWELLANGEKFKTSVREGKEYREKTPEYWYTSGSTIHWYIFNKSRMYNSWEETSSYLLSPGKDTLYLDGNTPLVRQ